MPRGFGRPATGLMIRDYLLRKKVAYVMQIWREGIVEPCKEQNFKYGCWADFSNYFSKLKRLRLVVFDHAEPAPELPGRTFTGEGVQRHYYRLNMERVNDMEVWRNPIKALYPHLFNRPR